MLTQEIIKFLRQSVIVQDPDVASVDEDFLTMKDEDFIPLLTISLAKVDPSDSINNLSNDNLYPLVLVAKKELYHRLAVKSSPTYSLTSATGVQLKRGEVFDHYYKLIEEVESEYKNYLATGVVVKTGEVLLSSRYFTTRNYNLASKPSVILNLDNIYSDKVEISWALEKYNKFAKYIIYIGTEPNIDIYNKNAINVNARKVETIKDIHRTRLRISDLVPDTEYYITIIAEERNGLQGYEELKFTTLGGV